MFSFLASNKFACYTPRTYIVELTTFLYLYIHFITAQSKEKEEQRVTKEMAHIRKEFKENKGIDGYQRRKYVCKLLYIYMLGYDLDFGHMEAVTLISSNKYQEKLIVCLPRDVHYAVELHAFI